MKTLLSVALTVCAMLGLSRSTSGDMILIDDFSETSQSVVDNTDDAAAVTSKVAATKAIGGFRYLSANMVTEAAPGLGAEVKIDVNSGNDDSAYSAFLAKGEFSFGYDGNSGSLFNPGANLGFFDLSEMHMLGITASTEYLAGGPPIPEFGLVATLYNGTTPFTQNLTVSGSTLKEYRIALSDFLADGIDLTKVTGIEISSQSASTYKFNQSVTLTQIRTFQTPEPSSMILLTLTGMGFAGATWRRRRKQALAA